MFFNIRKSFITLFALILALLGWILGAVPVQASANIYRVAPTAATSSPCGADWSNPCDLQYALTTLASAGDEIWVAAGVYKPTKSTDRTISFVLKNGVAIYGGFAGTETIRDQRNPAANVTILSGDIDNNDSQAPIITDITAVTGNTTNSYHVVTGATGATLDGFTITAGSDYGGNLDGGGMYNINSSPTVTNVTFSGNLADRYGGGMYNYYSSPTVTNVTFNGNKAGEGGGMGNYYSNPTVTYVTFSANKANHGGGMYNDNSSPTVMNVTFSGNQVDYAGGGMENYSSSPTVTNVTFSSNTANQYGGGMYNQLTSSPAVTNVIFSGNSAGNSGGGMYNYQSSSNPRVTNVTFSGNSAQRGGGMYNYWSSTITTNVTFSSNSVTNSGGGMYNYESNPMVTNVTFSGNEAATSGGGMYSYQTYNNDYGRPTLKNVIIANSVGGDCALAASSTLNAASANNLIEDNIYACGLTSGMNGNIIGSDPNLGLLADNGGLTQTHALLTDSPAIETGNDNACPATDQRGVLRPQGGYCDMGAYEYEGPFLSIPTPTQTFTPTATPTNTPTLIPTATSTPISNCNTVYHGPLTLNGGLSMSIMNQTGFPLVVQDVFVTWNHDKGHSTGVDKTLLLQQASLNGLSFWNGNNSGPSFTITPSALSIPTGNSNILFSFHQSYDFLDGTEQIFITLGTNGCQSYPIDSNTVSVTNTPTPTATFTPTNTATFTPTATPPYSYNPLYISLTGSQTIGGISSANEDILKFDGQNWSLFFDGSDVGLSSLNLSAFSILDSDTILMSFNSAATLNGIAFTPQDVARFDATSLGSTTAGIFSMYFDGSDVGLDTSSENIDSLSLLPDGRLLISTTGNPSVPGVSGAADEDVLAFTPSTLGDSTSGSWAIYFDGSDVGLADSSNEDVDALDVTSNGNIYLSTLGDFAVNGIAGADEDVFVCVPSSVGLTTVCNYSPVLYFDGSTWGLSNNDVDAFNYLASGSISTATSTSTPIRTNTPFATNTPTQTLSATATFTKTATSTAGPSPTNTPTQTPSFTPTNTATATKTSTPTNTVTSTATLIVSSFTFLPIDDAYIAGGSPTTNYGSATTLQVDNSPIKHFLLKFVVSGLNGQQITSAKLRLYNVDPSSKGGDFYVVSDNSWQEETVTWNNAPAALTNLLASLGSVSTGNWYEIDLTPLITGEGTYSLRISSTSSDGADYSSKEGTSPPQLVITVH